jgi:hypothetical protein
LLTDPLSLFKFGVPYEHLTRRKIFAPNKERRAKNIKNLGKVSSIASCMNCIRKFKESVSLP